MFFGRLKNLSFLTIHLTIVMVVLACSGSKSKDHSDPVAEGIDPDGQVASPTGQSGDSFAASKISEGPTQASQLSILAGLPDNTVMSFWLDEQSNKSFWFNQSSSLRWDSASSPFSVGESIKSIKSIYEVSGKVMVAWIQEDGDSKSLWASMFDGISWGEPNQISQYGSPSQYELITTRSGEFLIVWSEDGQMWKKSHNGEFWEEPIDLGLTLSGARYLNIEVTIDSKILLVWSSFKDNKRYLWAGAYFDEQWDSLQLITEPQNEIVNIETSITENNKLIMMWKEQSQERQDIWVSFYGEDFSWQNPEKILEKENPINHERVRMHANGNAVLTWIEPGENYDSIQSKVFNGSTWSENPILVEQNLENDSFYKIETDSFSQTHLIWSQSDGSLWMNSLEAGTWTKTLRLTANSYDPVVDYAIGFNKAGRSFIVWSQRSTVWFKTGPN